MRVLVVCETYWGNTAQVAEAVASELVPAHRVKLLAAGDVDDLELRGVDLLVVGAPTHMHGLPRPRSRALAVRRGRLAEERLRSEGVGELLERLPHGEGTVAAAFDTRLAGRRLLTGATSRVIARRLRRAGYPTAVAPESFIVAGSPPVLRGGEPERARAWARGLVEAMARSANRPRPSSPLPASPA